MNTLSKIIILKRFHHYRQIKAFNFRIQATSRDLRSQERGALLQKPKTKSLNSQTKRWITESRLQTPNFNNNKSTIKTMQ